ncbi:hypothetical protein [Bacillus inaquosorum]|uniref:hypothetical protein n=1 Tax=Bacillus inaquosorum TaxID=483913 RepID=UPI003D1FC173
MDKALANLLRRFQLKMPPITEKRILKEVLDDCKEERKKLSKEEIKEKGLNIYEKQGIRVSELLNEAIKRGLVDAIYDDCGERKVSISQEGIEFLTRFYTNDFSDQYLQFEKEINQTMREHNDLELNQLHIASLFWDGFNAKDVFENYQKSEIQKEMEAYHHHLLQLNGVSDLGEKYIFHFMPKLFLPMEWFNTNAKDIVLQIKGIEAPSEMILTKPYPNTRYVVAGMKFGREKISSGFYPIIDDKEDFPEKLDITLQWSIGDYMKIIHELRINFAFADHAGSFFSSEQYLSRNSNLNEFDLITYVEKDAELWRDRNYLYHSKPGEVVIEENVTLSHFPIKLHFPSFDPDPHFRKWIRKWREHSALNVI